MLIYRGFEDLASEEILPIVVLSQSPYIINY